MCCDTNVVKDTSTSSALQASFFVPWIKELFAVSLLSKGLMIKEIHDKKKLLLEPQMLKQPLKRTVLLNNSYPVSLADSAGVLEVSRPGQAEGASLEITVGEHVGQAERVVILL